jgi:hypothetical protein
VQFAEPTGLLEYHVEALVKSISSKNMPRLKRQINSSSAYAATPSVGKTKSRGLCEAGKKCAMFGVNVTFCYRVIG